MGFVHSSYIIHSPLSTVAVASTIYYLIQRNAHKFLTQVPKPKGRNQAGNKNKK